MARLSADERRASVVRAAVTEFSRAGYAGTSTEVIARRVGVSQPYLFRLFPGKQAIFLAAASHNLQETHRVLVEAAREVPPEEAERAMALAYKRLIADHPDALLMQMQTYVAVAAAEASGDHEFGKAVRAVWLELWDSVHLSLGADADVTTGFLGYGMLINALVSMGFPVDSRVWEGFFWEGTRPELPSRGEREG